MPTPKKPQDRKLFERPSRAGLTSNADLERRPTVAAHPAAKRGWLKLTKDEWKSFWTTDLAKLVVSSDLPALVRMHDLKDEADRCRRAVRKTGTFVQGSMGQPVENPLLKRLQTLDSEVRQLEDRFGLSPAARMKLGISFGEASRSLAELNAAIDDVDGNDGDREPDDPRAALRLTVTDS